MTPRPRRRKVLLLPLWERLKPRCFEAISLLCAGVIAASAAHAESLVVRAGHLIDVEQGKVLDDQAIRIVDGRIVSIAPYTAAESANTKLLDWSPYTVVPGLMDMHTHLIGDITSADPAAPLLGSGATDALQGVANARATLRAGFTTVRDVGTYRAFVDVALRDAIDKGIVDGPRMFVAGAYVTVNQGGGEVTGLPPGTVVPAEMRRGVANSETEVHTVVRELLAGGADFIKMIATGAVLTAGTQPGNPEFTEAEIRAAVQEAAARGKYVTAHAHGAEGIKNAVRAGVRSIEHGSLMDDEAIALMARHGTWLVADIYNGDYIEEIGRRDGWSEEVLRKNRETTDVQRSGFAKAVKAGVPIAFGTDSGVYPHGENGRQFAYMVRYGMTPWQAIRSATIDSARLLGRDKEIGSIAPGKAADMIAVACDPLKDIECLRRIRGVVKAGKSIALD